MSRASLRWLIVLAAACTHTVSTDHGTDSETDTETDTDTAPCRNSSDKLVEWIPEDWQAAEVDDEELGHRDGGLYLGELPDHPNWGYHEVIVLTFEKWQSTVDWTRLMEPF
jgi:hypothetical protein